MAYFIHVLPFLKIAGLFVEEKQKLQYAEQDRDTQRHKTIKERWSCL